MFYKTSFVKFTYDYRIEIIYFDLFSSFLFNAMASALNLSKEHFDY